MSHTPEAHADDMEDAAAMMAGSLSQLRSVTGKSLDPRAVFLAMSRTAGLFQSTALELARQGWVTPDDDPEALVQWKAAMDSLGSVSGFFSEVANGWI